MPEVDREAFFQTYFEQSCPPDDIAGDYASALIGWVKSGRDPAIRMVECRKTEKSKLELLVVEIDVSLGQRKPVNSILETERIGIVFGEGTVPSVFPLRSDFPCEVPHLNIAYGDAPESLCLFDLPAEEVLRILSPTMLIERTRWWLRETAHGRLHGEDQPLDPLFAGIAHTVILPELDDASQTTALIGFKRSNSDASPILVDKPHQAARYRIPADAPRFSCVVLSTNPVPHGRLRSLPRDMEELIGAYSQRDIDLVPDMVSQFRGWLQTEADSGLFQNHCLIIVSTPIERSPGKIDAVAVKGFFSICDAITIATALGAVIVAEGSIARPLIETPVNYDALKGIALEPANIHQPFNRQLAQNASGYPIQENSLKILQIGAGALGSQIALNAARGGIGEWTIVDPDHLLPHNLARHASSKSAIGVLKAEAVAGEINGLLGRGAAVGHGSEIQSLCEENSFVYDFDIVLDASASVPVARWLAGLDKLKTEAVSVFVNPTGTDLVMLREGEQRQPRLDHLEMDYYWHLVCEPELADHLKVGDTIMPSGGCRRPSVKIAQPKISIAAAQVVTSIFASGGVDAQGSIELFQSTIEGTRRFSWGGTEYVELELDGWRIAISSNVFGGIGEARAAAGHMETGGILIGSWDRQLRKGWIVAHQDPPPDSEHNPTSFVRGSVGVYRTLTAISEATAANLGYVGEWHTHPAGHSNQASSDDALLMRWIGGDVQYNDLPALMMIGGEDGLRLYARTIGCSAAVER